MPPLSLPNVTLVAIDSVAHALTRLAIEDTLAQIQPKELIVASNDAEIVRDIGDHMQGRGTFMGRDDLNSLHAVAKLLWYDIPTHVTTSHILLIQYDGFVLNSSAWRPDFLTYDYIGAPWPWHQTHQVGNGGFSLRSIRLMRHLAAHVSDYPLDANYPEDAVLCRLYRNALEHRGFRFAPVSVASQFSFEREPPRPSFGFHGLFNLPHVLGAERFDERKRLANDYVRGKIEWKELGP